MLRGLVVQMVQRRCRAATIGAAGVVDKFDGRLGCACTAPVFQGAFAAPTEANYGLSRLAAQIHCDGQGSQPRMRNRRRPSGSDRQQATGLDLVVAAGAEVETDETKWYAVVHSDL